MQMILDVKHGFRGMACFVVGGHVIDSTGHMAYSSTIKDLLVRLMLLIAVKHDLGLMAGNIGNAFCTVLCAEKIWSAVGDQFGNKKGSIVVLKRALFRLKTVLASFHQLLGDFLREMGFVSSGADQDLWLQKLEEYAEYNYIAMHVDDNIIIAKNPSKYMMHIEHHFQVHNIADSSSYYLDNDLIKQGKLIHLSTKNYIKEVLRKYQDKYGLLAKETLPLKPKLKPELDDYPLVDEAKHKEYVINPALLKTDVQCKKVELKLSFGNQCSYFREELDPRFPELQYDEMDAHVFCDADHGHDQITRMSITGLFTMVCLTPMTWLTKRQKFVHASTFRAECTTLKAAVEEAVSMGIKVSRPAPISAENMSMVIIATNPGSTLNKKTMALSYHFVRDHVANRVVEARKIVSEDNFANPSTKALVSNDFHGFYHECMVNR
eukprot:13602272-Ditylum_brightwellii.AAC.4